MDPLTIIFAICAALIIIAAVKRFAVSPGDVGEHIVARKLSWLPNEYFTINDLLFHVNKGHTTQIDHVVVSPYGIFVIETKNHSGYVYGSEHSATWKKYWKGWYHGIEHSDDLTFKNPIQQNKAHIEALKKALCNFEHVQLISIIAFSPNAELKVKVENANVMYWSQVRRFIRRHNTPILSIEETQQIYEYLLAINVRGKDAREKHAARALLNMSSYEQRENEAVENGKCPKCGGNLVKRTGTYGAFFGCSNYPNCKYTHPAY